MYAFPTGSRLFDRIKMPHGLAVVNDPERGWMVEANPWLGDLLDLTEGVDYFLGGHNYDDVSDETFAALAAAGFVTAPVTYPDVDVYPETFLYPQTDSPGGYGDVPYGFGPYGG